MKEALRKEFFREIKKSKSRFISIFFIVALGAAFFSGVRSSEPDMRYSADRFYDESNMMDVRVISTLGLTKSDLDAISAIDGVERAAVYMTEELSSRSDGLEYNMRKIATEKGMDDFVVEKGKYPENEGECLLDQTFAEEQGLNLGDTLSFSNGERLTIVGIGNSSWYLSWDRGTCSIGNGKVNAFVVVPMSSFKGDVYSEIHIHVAGAKELMSYSEEYEDKVNEVKDRIEDIAEKQLDKRKAGLLAGFTTFTGLTDQGSLASIKDASWYVLDRNSLETYVEYGQDTSRIGALGNVFPLIFFIVASLVSLTTMTRMVEEQRMQIGTLKALGYSSGSITAKYLLYALLATLFGGFIGVMVGEKLFPFIIITAYGMMYVGLPEYFTPWQLQPAIVAVSLSVACTTLAAIAASYKVLMERPAELMRPVSPRAGKRVLIERIAFIWKRLNFTKKSTIRNLLRYKKRFFMTIFGIGGCMALLIVGFGLRDSIFDIVKYQYKEIFKYNLDVQLTNSITKEEQQELLSLLEKQTTVDSYLQVYNKSIEVVNDKNKKTAVLYVPEKIEDIRRYIELRNRKTKKHFEFPTTGVAISEKLASTLGLSTGDTIDLKLSETDTRTIEISCIIENYLYNYVFMSVGTYQELFHSTPPMTDILVLTNSQSKDDESNLGATLIATKGCSGVRFITEFNQKLTDLMSHFNIIVWVLIVSAGFLAFVVLYNLNNINITERKRELATIKLLGFYDGEVASYVYRENVLLTLLGSIVGIFLGMILHSYVVKTVEVDIMMFGRTIKPLSYVYGFVMTILFSTFVNFVMYFHLKKIDMVESLKSVE